MANRSRVFSLELKNRFHSWQTGRKAKWISWGFHNLAMRSEEAPKHGNEMKDFLTTDGLHEWTWTGLAKRRGEKEEEKGDWTILAW